MKHCRIFTIFIVLTAILYSCSNESLIEESNSESELKSADFFEDQESISLQVTTESFWDFFDKFMYDKEFQKNRIDFPINYIDVQIPSSETWNHLSFYWNEDYMPVLYTDTAESMLNTLPDSFIVSTVSFKNYSARNYYFKKYKDYTLYKVDSSGIKEIADGNFLSFLIEFSRDSVFQLNHVKFPFVNYYANDDFETVYDSILPKYWSHLNVTSEAEELMTFAYNITSPLRIVHYRGIENGIYFRYVFLKSNNKWQLVKMENYST